MPRRLMVPAISTLVMLVILISLGIWQLERRAWKLALLAQIDAAETHAAIPMPSLPQPFQKVRLEGRLRTDLQASYGFDVRDGRPGTQLIVPMERDGQPTVLVDLGFLPDAALHPFPLQSQAVEGFIRPAEHAGMLAATDNPAQRRFYTLDPAAIGASLGETNVAPYTLIVLGPVVAGQIPEPSHAMPRPPNDHLNYAFTWFGFAVTLSVIFVLYARKSRRS
ncbi:MAG: SURF1 family protein [Acetobacteraceae bacterium]|nr:SURF1 family protein [Acetobacteraceae bacterium]